MEFEYKRKKGNNIMSQNEIISKIEQLREWESILEEAQAEVETLRDCIKAQMLERDTEELQVGTYIIKAKRYLMVCMVCRLLRY